MSGVLFKPSLTKTFLVFDTVEPDNFHLVLVQNYMCNLVFLKLHKAATFENVYFSSDLLKSGEETGLNDEKVADQRLMTREAQHPITEGLLCLSNRMISSHFGYFPHR